MSGSYESCVVYGWEEDRSERVINIKWLKLQYESVSIGVSNVNNHYGNAVCGIICRFNSITGQAYIGEDDKYLIEDLYNKVKIYDYDEVSPIGFYTCIIGDLSWDKYRHYIPHHGCNSDSE